MPAQLAVIGDIHGAFDDADVEHFNRSDYRLLLFVGDLGSFGGQGGRRVARQISRLTRPALVLPGNHDGVNGAQLLAELVGSARLAEASGGGQGRKVAALRRALAPATLAGYSRHAVPGEPGLEVIAARPHSMGGDGLAFRPYLYRAFGIDSLAASAARLCELVDESDADRLIFLAHNGPSGLGAAAGDIWGCDFRRGAGDFGDADLRRAVDHALDSGKRVIAVVAGHMHHRLKGGGERTWTLVERGVAYVNAARVPRIVRRGGERLRYHVRLATTPTGATVSEMSVPG